jgi:glutathionylspermidine synthase
MSDPTARPLPDYASFARAVYETGALSDPWLDGTERFGMQGALLTADLAARLAEAAEAVTYLHQELVEILLENPQLTHDFFHLTPYQQAMWEASGGLWHGMARADLFVCDDGAIRCCELNSDTPSGQPEAVLLNRLLHANHGDVEDPNADFGARFVDMLRASRAKCSDQPLSSVGIVYPTELTEDLGMIAVFTRWMETAGIKVVSGSPFNLRRGAGGVEIFGAPVDLVVRHYKTDWWGERQPVWADAEGFLDPDPLTGPLRIALEADLRGEVTIVNPFGSVVTQNKLALAFFWEEMNRFAEPSQKLIRKYLPETYRFSGMSPDQLRAEREGWVLKSDYGCEGSETVCGPFVTQEIWEKTVDLALPERFVAQRFFTVRPDADGLLPNYGVFVLGGGAAGFFTRLSRAGTEYNAVTAPTFILKSS